jgi:hypothetical protein
VNARVFAALIRRNKQNYRKKTEKVRKIFRILKKEYTQVIAIFMKDICQIVAAQICTIKRKVVTFGVLYPFGLMVHIV